MEKEKLSGETAQTPRVRCSPTPDDMECAERHDVLSARAKLREFAACNWMHTINKSYAYKARPYFILEEIGDTAFRHVAKTRPQHLNTAEDNNGR